VPVNRAGADWRFKEISMIRYVLHPGYVISKTDGDDHYIDGPTLARLYQVDFRLCVIANKPGFRSMHEDINLYPRHDGEYNSKF
jgi:hypothetical protein